MGTCWDIVLESDPNENLLVTEELKICEPEDEIQEGGYYRVRNKLKLKGGGSDSENKNGNPFEEDDDDFEPYKEDVHAIVLNTYRDKRSR